MAVGKPDDPVREGGQIISDEKNLNPTPGSGVIHIKSYRQRRLAFESARRYCFNNIGENQLKNAVMALGGTGSYEELVSGIWELNFTVNYEETMKTWAFNGENQASGLPVKKIAVSPL